MRALLLVVCAGLAVAVWWLARKLRRAERAIYELRLLRREIDEVREVAGRDLAVTRAHLAALSAGEPPGREAILEGRPYGDVSPSEALALYEGTSGLFVLDVRTRSEYAAGHIPGAHLLPVDEIEGRLAELPAASTVMLVTCAAGGRSAAACDILARRGYGRLLNLRGGMGAWPGPSEKEAVSETPVATSAVAYRGGSITSDQVLAAIRECYDPEIPVNIYDLGLIYAVDIGAEGIAVRMTLTSHDCPSAQTIPEDIRRRIAALGQPNVSVDVVWEPPWHPSRISAEGKRKLGLG